MTSRNRGKRWPVSGLASVLIGLACLAVGTTTSGPAAAAPPAFSFSTGSPDGLMAMASPPASIGVTESEAADDFIVDQPTTLNSATFVGLIPTGTALSDIAAVDVEIYRVFPLDSVDPPAGAVVPTRVNSPSDVAFASRGTGSADATFSAAVTNASFTAANSVAVGGIHPSPNQMTGGNGAVAGQEVTFTVTFTTPIDLPADHYFFVPQVQLPSGQTFSWLSAPKPIVAPGTPILPDLQAWIRTAALAPDWLRVGTDIVGGAPAPTYNGAFSLAGALDCPTMTIAPATLPDGTVGASYTQVLTTSGGTGPFSYAETGALPDGVTLGADGTLAGTPTASGTFPLAITSTDSIGCEATASRPLVVAEPATTTTTSASTTSVAPSSTVAPTTTALATTTTTGAVAAADQTSLPVTGIAAGWWTALGTALLLAGGLLVLASRRRHADA